MTPSTSVENTNPETYYERPEGEAALDQNVLDSTSGIVLDEQEITIDLVNSINVKSSYDVVVQTRMSSYVSNQKSSNSYTISVRVYMPTGFDANTNGWINEYGNQLMLVHGHAGDIRTNQGKLFNTSEGATYTASSTNEGYVGYYETSFIVPNTMNEYTVSVYNEASMAAASKTDYVDIHNTGTSYEYSEITNTEQAVYTYTFFTAEGDETATERTPITYNNVVFEDYSTSKSQLEYSFYIDLGSINSKDLTTTIEKNSGYTGTDYYKDQFYMDSTIWVPFTSTTNPGYRVFTVRTDNSNISANNDNLFKVTPYYVEQDIYFVEVDIDMLGTITGQQYVYGTTNYAVTGQMGFGTATSAPTDVDYSKIEFSTRIIYQPMNGTNQITQSDKGYYYIQSYDNYVAMVNRYEDSLPDTGLAPWAWWTIGTGIAIVLIAGLVGTVAFARYEYKKHHKHHEVSLEHAAGLDKVDKNLRHEEVQVAKTTKTNTKGGKK